MFFKDKPSQEVPSVGLSFKRDEPPPTLSSSDVPDFVSFVSAALLIGFRPAVFVELFADEIQIQLSKSYRQRFVDGKVARVASRHLLPATKQLVDNSPQVVKRTLDSRNLAKSWSILKSQRPAETARQPLHAGVGRIAQGSL